MNKKNLFTVGEVAKMFGSTVRTLQYYDQLGILSPATHSEGKRRLYSHEDIAKFHQINSMKFLGFSLEEIKKRMNIQLTPLAFDLILEKEEMKLDEEIKKHQQTLDIVRKLRAEAINIEKVDFQLYAAIIENIRRKNDFYHFVKYFDDELIAFFANRYRQGQLDYSVFDQLNKINDELYELAKKHVNPGDQKAQNVAKKHWDLTLVLTGGDISILTKLASIIDKAGTDDEKSKGRNVIIQEFLKAALEIYLADYNFESEQ